jgi:tagaturonate reductase
MMKLTRANIGEIAKLSPIEMPDSTLLQLPEKVIQFGTGVFIRGLIDYLIDKSNRAGIFNGRVIAVKSTDAGDVKSFAEQDCLYTLVMRGLEDNKEKEEVLVCSAVSRVLSAKEDWDEILKTAHNPDLEIIISNTTEVGIALVADDNVQSQPPLSFPGKLLRYLLERYNAFNGNSDKGFVIVPTELIADNATKLKAILNELAVANKLESGFIQWMNEANDFCNSLVDRIVPGKPLKEDHIALEALFGYEDNLMVMSETFALWAIQSERERTKQILSFSTIHPQIYIVPDISKFRELKLRLLNGSHNLTCAVGVIAGFQMVRDAMLDDTFSRYINRLILDEIAPSIVSATITLEDAREFGSMVLDRYCNQHIAFKWLDICVQDTSKVKIRAIPIVFQHYEKYGFVPECISLSLAAYILFMKSEFINGQYIGEANGKQYRVVDDFADIMYEKWRSHSGLKLVQSVLGDVRLWDADLSAINGLNEKVLFYLGALVTSSFSEAYKLLETQNNR